MSSPEPIIAAVPDRPYLLALDPGNIESGWVVIDRATARPMQFGKTENRTLLEMFRDGDDTLVSTVAIEMIKSYGMPVGEEIFETCVWIGKFEETFERNYGLTPVRVGRKEAALHHCHSPKAGDANVKQALIDRFAPGVRNHGKGLKAEPGWFYGFFLDVWAAYSVGIYVLDHEKALGEELPGLKR